MKQTCELCRRLVETWRKPVIFANRVFCDRVCESDFKEIQENIYGVPARREPPRPQLLHTQAE